MLMRGLFEVAKLSCILLFYALLFETDYDYLTAVLSTIMLVCPASCLFTCDCLIVISGKQ